jgi:hypothetical protein
MSKRTKKSAEGTVAGLVLAHLWIGVVATVPATSV